MRGAGLLAKQTVTALLMASREAVLRREPGPQLPPLPSEVGNGAPGMEKPPLPNEQPQAAAGADPLGVSLADEAAVAAPSPASKRREYSAQPLRAALEPLELDQPSDADEPADTMVSRSAVSHPLTSKTRLQSQQCLLTPATLGTLTSTTLHGPDLGWLCSRRCRLRRPRRSGSERGAPCSPARNGSPRPRLPSRPQTSSTSGQR